MAHPDSSRFLYSAPDPVNSISCVSTSGGYGVILTWSCPSEGYETFEVEVGRQWISRNGSFCNKGVSVSDLGPAQSYMATITTVSNGLRAPSISVTCYTESAGEQGPRDKPSHLAMKGRHGLLLSLLLLFCFVLVCLPFVFFSFSVSLFLSECVPVCRFMCTCVYARGQRTILGVVHVYLH